MKANELRIGNWVKVGEHESIVDEITKDLIHVEGNWLRNRLDQIKPVLITEELLFKLGFSYGNRRWRLKSCDDKILYNLNTKKIQVSGYKNITVQYVHHLQNIYFALTGEELKYIL